MADSGAAGRDSGDGVTNRAPPAWPAAPVAEAGELDAGGSTASPGSGTAGGVTTANDAGTACPQGFVDCNGDPADGCELEPAKNPGQCSECARACGDVPLSSVGDGPSPAALFNTYVAHRPPPLDGSGAKAVAQAAAFIEWASASRPDEREDGRAVLSGASNNIDVTDALIAQYAASDGDEGRALLILSLIGELRNAAGEAFLLSIVRLPLPTNGIWIDGELLERAALEKLQAKAVDGLAYRNTDTANSEVVRLAIQSDSALVRSEAVRAFVYNNPGQGRGTITEIGTDDDRVLLDRVEHGPDATSTDSFDTRLAAFLSAHPEFVPPPPPAGVVPNTQTVQDDDPDSPGSANPIQ